MIAPDKSAHILAGAVIALALGYVTPAWVWFIGPAVIGLGKERYDYKHAGDASWLDFAATVLGGFAGAGFVLAVQMIKNYA